VYKYVVVDRSHQRSLAELRSIQDGNLRYQLETVSGRSGVATIVDRQACIMSDLDPT